MVVHVVGLEEEQGVGCDAAGIPGGEGLGADWVCLNTGETIRCTYRQAWN